MEQVAVKKCSVCEKNIEEPKLRIHEATCARNNFKCPKCGEVIVKSEKEHHEQEIHTEKSCPDCAQNLPDKNSLVAHASICEMKPKQCLFCELNVGGAQYESHLSFCGSKTQECPICNLNVCLKDIGNHEINGECAFHQDIMNEQLKNDMKKFEELAQREEEKQALGEPKQTDLKQWVTKPKGEQQQIPSSLDGEQKPTEIREEEHQDEDAKMIAQLMQEEMDMMEAQKFGGLKDHGTTTLNKPYAQPAFDAEYVRPPSNIYQDTLIGGPMHNVQFPHGIGNISMPNFNPISGGFENSYQPMDDEYGNEDSEMQFYNNRNPQPVIHSPRQETEDDVLKKAIEESMKGMPAHQEGVDDADDLIMQQILEESKKNV